MSAHLTLDRPVLQTLLASAFVVQESRLDPEALSTFLEVQTFIRTEEPDLARAMELIAGRASQVAHADGVAIALAKGDPLVYCAASGMADGCVGRQVGTMLFFSAHQNANSEVLKIEDGRVDPRSETAICREFKAESLLLLPLYEKQGLAGMLQVLFRKPHKFSDREVSAYRLMACLVEETISRNAQRAEVPAVLQKQQTAEVLVVEEKTEAVEATALAPAANPVEIAVAERPELPLEAVSAGAPIPVVGGPSWLDRVRGTVAATTSHLFVLGRANRVTVTIRKPSAGIMRGILRRAVPAGIVLGMLGGVSWLDWHLSTVAYGSSPQPSISVTQSASPFPVIPLAAAGPAQTLPEASESAKPPVPPKTASQERRATSGFKQVHVGPNEIDYVADDVTIRVFHPASKPAKQDASREVHMGDDVTMHLFPDGPGRISPAGPRQEGSLPGSSQ